MNWINRGTKVLQGNIDKGVNMKKALAIFVTVCLLASLFVSCDNTTKLDELVSTRFDAAGSRSLIVSNENFIDFNDSSIKWQYKAGKVTDPSYNVGAAADWTDIPGTTPGLLSNTIEFSQGKWNFELRAVKTTDTSVVIYYGKTEAPVLLEKQTSTNPQSIVINLTAQLSGQKGYIVLSNVSVKHTSNGSVAYDAPSKVIIDDTDTEKRRELVLGTDYVKSEAGDSISSKTGTGYQISVGTHTVKVQKIGANGETLAEEEKTIEVYAGLKTTISNWIVEITQAGKFDPVAPTGTTSGNVSSAVEGKLTLTVENVTPSMVSGKNTTVTVPTNALDSGVTTATVSVAVKQASEASTDNSFTASDGNTVAAVIDLTLSAGSNPVTNFSSPIKVETYVAKNLAGFSFGYPGETWTKKESLAGVTVARDYYYDSGEGKLTFLTDHFSSFIVETSSAAVIGDTAYNSLSSAISHVEEGQTITAIKDVSSILSSGIKIDNGKTFTIDLNGHNYDKRLTIKNSNITIKNGTISGVDQPIVIYASTNDRQYNSVTIENDVKIIGTRGFGIVIYPVDGYQVGYGTVLNLNGSIENVESGLFVLGTINNSINDSSYPVKVNIGPTAKITSFAGGIHENGTAVITVEEGAVFDCVDTAIEVRAGKLVINGGDFNATATPTTVTPNGSGSTTVGAAIGVAQHTTKLPISVEINGGTFKAFTPVNIKDPHNNNTNNVNVVINGGHFTTINGGTVSVDSYSNVLSINGGIFSSNPSDHLVEDYWAEQNEEGKYEVKRATDWIQVADTLWYNETESEFTISTARELSGLALLVNEGNNFSGKTINLDSNIDLSGKTWTPIGAYSGKSFCGIFDGNSNTISNLKIDSAETPYDANGLFGFISKQNTVNSSVKNIIICNANINAVSNGNGGIGVTIGNVIPGCTIDNIKVSGSTVVGNRWIGGIVGRGYCTISNCSVENISLTANQDNLTDKWDNGDKVGGIIGYLCEMSGDPKLTSCKAKDVTIVGYRDLGGIAGLTQSNLASNVVEGSLSIKIQFKDNYEEYNSESITAGVIFGRSGAHYNSDNSKENTSTANCSIDKTAFNN